MSPSPRFELSPARRKNLYRTGWVLMAIGIALFVAAMFAPEAIGKNLAIGYPLKLWCKGEGPAAKCLIEWTATFPLYLFGSGIFLQFAPQLYNLGVGFMRAKGWIK